MSKIDPSQRRHSGSNESRIPVPNSPSLLRRFGTCPPIQEQSPVINRHRSLQSLTTTPLATRTRLNSEDHDDDLDSLNSYGSCASAYSTTSQCDHASFARNGTTYSGRRRRYVVHCSPHSTAGDEYLTPTQRASRTIRKLKAQLSEAQAEIEEKDRQLFRLTKEVVQLRLLKVDSGTEVVEPDSSTRLSEPSAVHSQEEGLSQQNVVDLPPSLADSGHFEDLANGKEWHHRPPVFKDLELLQRQHEDVIRDLKEKHNDRVDALLQRITETNDRYYELRPKLEAQQSRIKELKEENEILKRDQLEAQNKLENVKSKNNELKLNIKIVEDKVQELENINNRLQIEKSESDHTANQKLEKKDENFESLQKHNKDLELRLFQLLNQNEELKQKIDNISKSEVDHVILEEEHENIDNLKVCYADLEIQFQNILQQNEELKLKNTYLSECNEQLKKIDETFVVTKKNSSTGDVCNMTNTEIHFDKIEALEREIESLKIAQKEQEEHHKKVYLEMYKKGQEAAKFEFTEGIESQKDGEMNEKAVELMKKLEVTQAELENVKVMYKRILETKKAQPEHDPEMTLQFLKSAIYYFLTDKENTHGHLAAIESILGFTETEKINIDKAYLWR